jgi:hypothetical protein
MKKCLIEPLFIYKIKLAVQLTEIFNTLQLLCCRVYKGNCDYSVGVTTAVLSIVLSKYSTIDIHGTCVHLNSTLVICS